MKPFIYSGLILLLATPLHAETYSWVDDSGTYNFTEDYSRVPKKYQKKVKQRDDMLQDAKPQLSPAPVNTPRQPDKTAAKFAAVPDGDKELFGGKSRGAWRNELDSHEAELSGIEQHMVQLKRQLSDQKRISTDQLEVLKKDYADSRVSYDQKYKNYSELIEKVRRAGISVEIKK